MADKGSQDPPRQLGRPRGTGAFDGTPVRVRLPAGLHDALSREALRRGEHLSQIIRERLTQTHPNRA